MSRRAAPFRQRDVTRAIKGAERAGLQVSSVEIMPDGSIKVGLLPEDALSAPTNRNVIRPWAANGR